MTRSTLSLAASLLLLTSSCADDAPSDVADAAPEGGVDAGDPFACPGGTVAPGENLLTVDGVERHFFADFPEDSAASMGVLFSWHGYGGNAADFRSGVALDPDENPSLPVVVITPDDTDLQPPRGLGWDIGGLSADGSNVDIAFFAAALGCLKEQYDIDETRIHSFGFSAGSVMTSLLHSRYPQLVSSIVSASGAWFNDPAQAELVNVFTIDWTWPELDPADGGVVLLTHGGPTDVTVFDVINLEDAAQAAFPFLAAADRVVVDCAHDGGHTLHPEVTSSLISAFISAHRAGEPSPYLDDGLESFPASCTLRLP